MVRWPIGFVAVVGMSAVLGGRPASAQAPTPELASAPPTAAHALPAKCADPEPPFVPYMLGDFVGPFATLFSDIKVAEGTSPRPIDRVFYKFNYYNNLNRERFSDPVTQFKQVDLYRNVFGFEKTLFDRRASLEIRIPYEIIDAQAREFRTVTGPAGGTLSVPGGPSETTKAIGNVNAVLKAVLWEDRATGDLLSGGITASVPTSSTRLIDPGPSTLLFLQPFMAGILNRGDFFVQGFTSITAPAASIQSILFFADVGVGYRLYKDEGAFLSGVWPTIEAHFATPLRQADPNFAPFGVFDDIRFRTMLNLTAGATFEFANRATLGVGFVMPATSTKPFEYEALAQLNVRF